MEIILLEKIRNLGDVGQVVNVKDGYGRNFLLKLGKALRADKNNIDFVNKKKDEINKKNIELKKSAKMVLEKILIKLKIKNLFLKKKQKKMGIYLQQLNLKKSLNTLLKISKKQFILHS